MFAIINASPVSFHLSMCCVAGFCLSYVNHLKDLEYELRNAVLEPVLTVCLLDEVVACNGAFLSYHYMTLIYSLLHS